MVAALPAYLGCHSCWDCGPLLLEHYHLKPRPNAWKISTLKSPAINISFPLPSRHLVLLIRSARTSSLLWAIAFHQSLMTHERQMNWILLSKYTRVDMKVRRITCTKIIEHLGSEALTGILVKQIYIKNSMNAKNNKNTTNKNMCPYTNAFLSWLNGLKLSASPIHSAIDVEVLHTASRNTSPSSWFVFCLQQFLMPLGTKYQGRIQK